MKLCPLCEQTKDLNEFAKNKTKLQCYCKLCQQIKYKEWLNKNKERKKEYDKSRREKRRISGRIWQKNNPEKVKQNNKIWWKRNKHKSKEYDKKRRAYKRQYEKNRRKQNVHARIAHNLRTRLRQIVKSKGFKKSMKTMEYLGCTYSELCLHLEKQFTFDMNWDNYGLYWEIDHIIPFSHLNLTLKIDLMKVCHYTNLRPLTINENRSRSKKLNDQANNVQQKD